MAAPPKVTLQDLSGQWIMVTLPFPFPCPRTGPARSSKAFLQRLTNNTTRTRPFPTTRIPSSNLYVPQPSPTCPSPKSLHPELSKTARHRLVPPQSHLPRHHHPHRHPLRRPGPATHHTHRHLAGSDGRHRRDDGEADVGLGRAAA